jgi:uncharacterized protein YqkB
VDKCKIVLDFKGGSEILDAVIIPPTTKELQSTFSTPYISHKYNTKARWDHS